MQGCSLLPKIKKLWGWRKKEEKSKILNFLRRLLSGWGGGDIAKFFRENWFKTKKGVKFYEKVQIPKIPLVKTAIDVIFCLITLLISALPENFPGYALGKMYLNSTNRGSILSKYN